jgi:hypothetical protein
MANITWDEDDLQNNRDNAGTTSDSFGDHSGDLQQGYPLGSLTDGLIAYYPFDGDTKDHALNNDGTDNTSAGYVSGQVGSDAKDFDASGSVGEIFPPKSEKFTLSAWVKVNDWSRGSRNYPIITDNNAGHDIRQDATDNRFEGHVFINNSKYEVGWSSPKDGKWHHLVCIYDGNSLRGYQDGVKKQENTSSGGNPDKSGEWSIGGRNDNTNVIKGKIDDVRIYDRALSLPEIKALYQRTSTQKITDQDRLTAGLVGHWPLNEDNNGTAYDLSGQGNDSTGTTGTTVKPGLGGTNARYFDGSDDEVSIYNSYRIFDDSKAWTVTYWTNPSSLTGSYPRHFTLGGERFVTGIINNNGNGNFQLRIHDGSNHYANITTSGTDTWYHVAYVHEAGGDYRAYKNGTLEDTINGSNVGTITSTSDDSKLGARRDGADNYNGKIQDFRIYNRSLTQSEIKTLARQGGVNTQ